MKEEEKSICWLGTIPECDKDKVRYPTEEEINQFIEEAENHIKQDDLKPRCLVTKHGVYETYLLYPDGRLMSQYKTTPEAEITKHKVYPSEEEKNRDPDSFRWRWSICHRDKKNGGKKTVNIHVSIAMGLTFPELLGESPLVRHFNLKYADDIQAEIPNGEIIRLLVNIDHIDQDKQNDEVENLRFCTSLEQRLNTGPKKGIRFKGVTKNGRKFRCQVSFLGRVISDNHFNTEEEAALNYNKVLKETLKEKFGNKLGQQLIDEVAYFNNALPKQQEFDF